MNLKVLLFNLPWLMVTFLLLTVQTITLVFIRTYTITYGPFIFSTTQSAYSSAGNIYTSLGTIHMTTIPCTLLVVIRPPYQQKHKFCGLDASESKEKDTSRRPSSMSYGITRKETTPSTTITTTTTHTSHLKALYS